MLDVEFEDFLESGAEQDDPADHPGESEYDRHYRKGGFGYHADREKWAAWVRTNYIDQFGLKRGKLLDVGCGDGFWSSLFADEGFEVSGFDTSSVGILTAQHRYPSVRFDVLSIDEPLPYWPESFDIVFCRSISHICGPDLTEPRVINAFAQAWSLVAPGGVLLLSAFSRGDGSTAGSTTMHPVEAFANLLETATGTEPYLVDVVANYVQVAVRRSG